MGLTKPRAAQIFNLDYKQSTRVVTATNITLTGGAPNSVDGVNLSLNDRILVTGQTTGSQNGLYLVTTLGSGSNGTWARTSDGNENGEIEAGMIVMVTEGTIYADTQWKLITDDPIVINTTALTFTQNYSANSISAGTSNVVVNSNANVTVSSAGTANVLTISSTGTVTSGTASITGNVTGGNILTAGIASVTGTITTAAGTNSTGFAVGNGAVSNVGLGFFPTAGTRGDYAIRDYSSVFSTLYLDVGMSGNAGGEFQFRSSNAFSLVMRANSSGVYTPGIMSATGIVYGSELNSTNSQTNEGGQINLALPSSGSTLSTSVIIDVFQNQLRFYEGGGTNRGAYIDLTAANASVGTNLLASGSGGTPGGSNTYVQFNDGGTFGGNGQFVYNKVTNIVTAGAFAGNTNGTGQNFQVGDDAWIGDINQADTIGLKGQQNAANCYIVFGNSDSTGKLGRAGTGPLTYAGAFSATGNVTGGNVLTGGIISATGNVTGNYILGNGSLLTGVVTSLANINNGTSNVTVVSSGGNVTVGIGGTSNVAVFATTGLTVAGVVSATGNVTGGNLLTAGLVSATSTITTAANITGGNIITAGLITATGNITGGNLIINNNATITGNLTVNGTETIFNVANLTVNDKDIIVANNVTGGANVNGAGLQAGNPATATWFFNNATTSWQSNIGITPTANGTLALGGASNYWGTAFITAANITGNVTGGNLLTAGLISATGNVIGNYFIGNGSQLTGISVSSNSISNGTSNVVIAAANGNINLYVAGQDTVEVSPGELTVYGVFSNPKTISSNVVIGPNINSMLIGPIAVDPANNIFVPTGSTLNII